MSRSVKGTRGPVSPVSSYDREGGRPLAITPPWVPAGKPRKSQLRETVETVVGAVLLAAFIMVFVARAFTVDGPSMLPTLRSGERLLVDKITYRFRSPEHGDVIVFRYPSDTRQHFIKRVVGLPGDLILIRNGVLLVNGVVVEEDYTSGPTLGNFGPYVVEPNSYFVLGDNRNNSEDSRSRRVGAVPRELIIGRALLRYWPLPRAGLIEPASVVWASP